MARRGQGERLAALRALAFEECRAAGCGEAYLLRLVRAVRVDELLGLLLAPVGMRAVAARGRPGIAFFRAAAAAYGLGNYGVYVDGEGNPDPWRRGGRAAFVGDATWDVRCVGPRRFHLLAAHGAEVYLAADAGARVRVWADAASRVRVAAGARGAVTVETPGGGGVAGGGLG